MDAYGIFQGGGAKGYAHVGALKAAEERNIRFIRIAGTSAGAIIAALVAAGYSADELLDPMRPVGERGALDVEVSDILDKREFGRISRFMERCEAFAAPSPPATGYLFKWHRAKRAWPFMFLRVLKLAVLEIRFLIFMYRQFGAVGTQPVVDWLDGLLRAKVGGDGPVTFGDLAMRLRIVAANLTTGEVQRFGFPGDEELPVARSAVASACFPFFFRPVLQGEAMFVDGGLVSNLPVWLFDDERDDDTSYLPTFGFRLVNDALVARPSTPPTRFIRFAVRMFQTLSSGARNLEERRIDYYHGIDLSARIGTLSFKTVRNEASALVLAAKRSVEEYFAREVGPQDPQQMQRVLSVAVNMLSDHYDWSGERVRAHILLPEPDGKHARTVYSCNMDHDADDRLRVRTDVDSVGAAFRLREPVYIVRTARRSGRPGALKYEFAHRPPEVTGFYSIPIFDDASEWSKPDAADRKPPFAALVIDRENDFASVVLDPQEQDMLSNVAAIVGEEIRDRTIVRDLRNMAMPAPNLGWDNSLSTETFRVALRKVRDPGDGEFGIQLSSALLRLK